jgi:hypothetical protein
MGKRRKKRNRFLSQTLDVTEWLAVRSLVGAFNAVGERGAITLAGALWKAAFGLGIPAGWSCKTWPSPSAIPTQRRSWKTWLGEATSIGLIPSPSGQKLGAGTLVTYWNTLAPSRARDPFGKPWRRAAASLS